MSNSSKKETTPLPVSEVHEVQRLPDATLRADSGSFAVLEGRIVSGSTQRAVTHVCVSGVRIPSARTRRHEKTD